MMASEEGFLDDGGGGIGGQVTGIENHVIGKRVINGLVEMGMDVGGAGFILSLEAAAGAVFGDFPLLGGLPEPLFERCDDADFENVGEVAGEDMGAAADENDIPHVGEFKNGVAGVVKEFPEGGVKAENFVNEAGKFAVFILGHIACEVLGELMVLEDFMDQSAVKECPVALGQPIGFAGELLGESGGDVV